LTHFADEWTWRDWIGLDWIGLDWIGLDWIGLDWIGLGWAGLGWAGLHRTADEPACVTLTERLLALLYLAVWPVACLLAHAASKPKTSKPNPRPSSASVRAKATAAVSKQSKGAAPTLGVLPGPCDFNTIQPRLQPHQSDSTQDETRLFACAVNGHQNPNNKRHHIRQTVYDIRWPEWNDMA
jgi:hypothetical protein